MKITKTYMGQFEDAADYFAQRGNPAVLAYNWLIDAGREFVAYAGAGDGVVFSVDGWVRIFAMTADTYLVSAASWIVAITRSDVEAEQFRGCGNGLMLIDSAHWETLEAKFSGVPVVQGPCHIAGVAPISKRKQAVLALADNAVQVLSFEPMTTRQARQWLQGWDNGIHRGNEASWRGDRITVYAGGKYYPAMCYEY